MLPMVVRVLLAMLLTLPPVAGAMLPCARAAKATLAATVAATVMDGCGASCCCAPASCPCVSPAEETSPSDLPLAPPASTDSRDIAWLSAAFARTWIAVTPAATPPATCALYSGRALTIAADARPFLAVWLT
jgi:hypothetical protein